MTEGATGSNEAVTAIELRILGLLSGAEDGRRWSHDQIAWRFGVGVERVRAIERVAREKLRGTE